MRCTTEKSNCAMRCCKIALLCVAGIAVMAWLVMQLWNCLLPDLFAGVARIGYWQALGLLLLSRILFSGLRGRCPGHWHGRAAHWQSMTPEERQHFKDRFRSRWGQCCRPARPDADPEDTPHDPR